VTTDRAALAASSSGETMAALLEEGAVIFGSSFFFSLDCSFGVSFAIVPADFTVI
jgi:hypothetical protein